MGKKLLSTALLIIGMGLFLRGQSIAQNYSNTTGNYTEGECTEVVTPEFQGKVCLRNMEDQGVREIHHGQWIDETGGIFEGVVQIDKYFTSNPPNPSTNSTISRRISKNGKVTSSGFLGYLGYVEERRHPGIHVNSTDIELVPSESTTSREFLKGLWRINPTSGLSGYMIIERKNERSTVTDKRKPVSINPNPITPN